jgi:hypothetical protein
MYGMAIKEQRIGSFAGGLNLRDLAGELAADEIPDALNVTIDERGAAEKRLGYENRFGSAVGSGLVSSVFDWASRGFLVSQIGAGMHIDNNAAFLTWSTSARCGMCEFLGNLVLIHPVDGVRIYDGTTVTGAPANSPLGDTCAAWQGKCWFAGNPTNPDRVTYTDIGAMTFNVNGWVALREKDTNKVTCLAGAAGLDVAGRPGLLAFKEDSAYRIYDSSNGAYQTIDAAVGAASNIAAISAYGRTYVANVRGIYYTNGIDPMVEASAKLEPLFHRDVINQTRGDLFCAGRHQDRLYFSLPKAGETANSVAIEHHPLAGWSMLHTNAASAYASKGKGATDMVMGSPSVAGRIYNANTGGSDAGTDIASYLQTFWTEPNFGNLVRVRRARFVGYGAFDAALYKDYEAGQSLPTLNVDITPEASLYDDGLLYDDDVLYGPIGFQEFQDFWSIGTCRAFSIRISETSDLTRPARDVGGVSVAEKGAWTLAHVNLMLIDLGYR